MSSLLPHTLITTLNLAPHPEGGHFRETYRAAETILPTGLPPRFSAERSTSTAIYYLLQKNDRSRLHRIQSDEVWHFYTGATLIIHVIHPDGEYQQLKLGLDLKNGAAPQHVVPHGVWFGAEVLDKTSFALVGCTVAPGFDFADFEMADKKKLLAAFPQHCEIIERMA